MEPFNIMAGFDDAFAQHACVMLQSVLESNPQHYFQFYLLVPEIFSATQTRALMDLRRSGRCDVQVIPVPSKYVSGVKVGQKITGAAYYRLLAGELLPTHVTRVLYLDSDVLVRGDLRTLWETDLQGFAVAAVRDQGADKDPRYRAAIGMSPEMFYFNSGVLLIDLERWRCEGIGGKVIEFSLRYPNRMSHDQCALNGFLQGRCLRLDDKWNAQSILFAHRENVPELLTRTAIVHFTNSNKPWRSVRAHPLAPLYLLALSKTSYYTPAAAFRWRCKLVWRRVARVLGYVRRLWPSRSSMAAGG
jgi:lipopolysaccharide biosynthesis glycosyltransferase